MKNHILSFLLIFFPLVAITQTVSFNFEGENLASWVQFPSNRWEVSSVNPLGGAYSLKHTAPSGTGKDRISIPLPAWSGSEGRVTWRFRVRHRFNPSSSNNWGVFLTLNRDAEGMVSGSGANGYAVGVNLTGSDDVLKLYKVRNGTFIPIIVSTINWETQIGSTLASVGAVEVERKVDGTFSLRVSTDGSFFSLQPQGSVLDSEFAFGGHLGASLSYTSTGVGSLMVDDISLVYKPNNPNDSKTIVRAPLQQVAAGYMSSLAVSAESAVEVFRMIIAEEGSTDSKSTFTTKIRLVNSSPQGGAVWSKAIGGVVLKSGGAAIPTQSMLIMDGAIEVEVDKNALVVDDNQQRDLSVYLFLKSEGVSDGATFQFKVDRLNHGWEADYTGSDFAVQFPLDVVSNVFTIKIVPTQLTFVDIPSPIVLNKPFDVVAHATDEQGNLASTYAAEQALLSVYQGYGVLTPSNALATNVVNGVATWAGITYSAKDEVVFRAVTSGLNQALSGAITVENESTSYVIEPKEQVAAGSVSSTQVTLGFAQEVFRFDIVDAGGFDSAPTHVRQIFIKRPAGLNLASFSGSIAGVALKANKAIVPIGNPHILTASISIPLPENALVVPNGDTVAVSLWVYLKSGGLADATNLRFMLDAEGHGFVADANGSGFINQFPQQVVSSPATLDVDGTRLAFTSVPQYVGKDEAFTVEVAAVDDGGSVDIHATGTVALSKNLGDGWLTVPATLLPLVGGKTTWNELSYSYFTPVPFSILASASAYNDVVSPLVFCSDRDSRLQETINPLENGVIPSTAISEDDAVEVFRLRVADSGKTDGLETRVTQMVFRSVQHHTDRPLNKLVAGAVVWVNGVQSAIASVTITATSISISFGDAGLAVADGSTVDISLGVYLLKGGQVEGSTISLYIPAMGHGWQTALTGSGFPSVLESSLMGPVLTVDVQAVMLYFVEQPFMAQPAEAVSLSVAATDAHGNIDVDATGGVTLSLDYGAGSYTTASNVKPLQSGVARWDDIVLNAVGRYRFKATGSEIMQGLSEPIWRGVATACTIDEGFEGDMLGFSLNSHWDVSTVSPIAGGKSLKHALSGVGGESCLEIPLGVDNMGESPMEWSMVVRNGSWDPSSDNTFWFVLVSDGETIKPGEYSGYAVGVNLQGTNDLLSLWRVAKGQPTQVVIQSEFDWGESETVNIRVTRTPNGEWTLWYQHSSSVGSPVLAGKAVDARHTKARTCGPVYKYTASRAGELWFDNVRVCASTYPPTIQSARMLSLTSIDVNFLASVNRNDASDASKYAIVDSGRKTYRIIAAYTNADDPKRVTLRTDQLPLSAAMLHVAGVRSATGTTTISDSIAVGLGASGTFGSIVINEIMARPSPVVGLPNVEYVELYNRSSQPLQLKGWRIRGNSSYANIPDATIAANGYLLLSSSNGAASMAGFGQTVGVTSFPSLLVGGMFLGIYDGGNNLITWVEYTDGWYGSDQKKAGGYSLERMDPNNLVEGAANWSASNHPLGGTPCTENSVRASNPDITSPRIVEVKVLSATKIEVGFSEPMDSLSITLNSSYSISRGIGSPIWAISPGPRYNRIALEFETPMADGEIYDLCFSQTITDFSGNALAEGCFYVAVPQEPQANDIIINEVLFNPYTGGVDFVEVYNRSSKVFDLYDLWIANRDLSTQGLNEYYRASGASWLLLPNSYAVLAEAPQQVEQFYLVENPAAMITTPRMPAYPNDSGYVLLLTEMGDEIDELAYTEKMHHPLLVTNKGVSLERIHPDLPSHDSSNWQSAAQMAGFATPTARNSQFTEPTEAKDSFTLSSQTISPDGDGFEDYLLINYDLPESSYMVNVQIFDSMGRRVKRLITNQSLGTSGSFKWDGTTDAGGKTTMGAYVVYIEAFDLRGNLKRYKKTVVVATRLRN